MSDENLMMLQLYVDGAQPMFSSCVLDDTVTIPASSVETTTDKGQAIVVEGATVECDKGSHPCRLIQPNKESSKTGEKLNMYERNTDRAYFGGSFGMCSMSHNACDPDCYEKWFDVSTVKSHTINPSALDDYYAAMKKAKSEAAKFCESVANEIDIRLYPKSSSARHISWRQHLDDGRLDMAKLSKAVADETPMSAGTERILDGTDEFYKQMGKAEEALFRFEVYLRQIESSPGGMLHKESRLVCWKGGMITIVDSGQIIEETEEDTVAIKQAKEKEETIVRWREGINNKKNVREEQIVFANSVIEMIYDKSLSSGIPAQLIFGQMMLETSYGADDGVKYANNYFGIKGTGPAGRFNSNTKEVINNQVVQMKDNFRAYHNMEESFDDYIDVMNKLVTPKVSDNTLKSWTVALENSPYSTTPDYGNYVTGIAKNWGITEK